MAASASILSMLESETTPVERLPGGPDAADAASGSGELPVTLSDDGTLRVGSSCALAGVPPFWAPFQPSAAAAGGGGLFLGAHLQRDAAPYHRLRLAQTLRCRRFLACARVKLWWMQPSWGGRGEEVPPETQFLLLELGPDGPYAVILPLICESPAPDGGPPASFRCTVRGMGSRSPSSLYAVMESGCPAAISHTLPALFYVGGGADPYEVVAQAFRRVSAHLGTFSLREDKPAPPALDTFGWCTWDAFYHGVSSEGVSAGLTSLARAGAPPRFLIIDDGWQTVAPDPEFRRLLPRLDSLSLSLTSAIGQLSGLAWLFAWAVVAAAAASAVAVLTLLALDYPTLSAYLFLLWFLPRLAGALSLASLAERLYWRHIHTLAYGSRGWRAIAYLAHEPVVRRRIRAAAAALGTFNHRLTSLGANTKFRQPGEGASHGLATEGPLGGLASVVAHAKEVHGVRHLYVWHALHGYWGGVAPTAPGGLALRHGVAMVDVVPSPGLLEVEPSMAWDPVTLGGVGLVEPADCDAFYEALHAGLRAAGVDGVKVDGQALVTTLGAGRGGGSQICRQLHGAMNASVTRNFGPGSVINCMCHSTDNIYHFGDSAMCRASDDFFPRNAASWTAHIVAVTFNSVFLGEVVFPDWDMFQSAHPAAGLHAAARAVGGCAVYVSDAPGKHDSALLRRLVLPDGGVLRALLPGRPTVDCLFSDVARDGRTALKIWNRNAQTGVVGCFNCQGSFWDSATHQFVRLERGCVAVTARVSPADVPGFVSAGPSGKYAPGEFALFCHVRCSLTILSSRAALSLELQPGDWEVVTVAQVKRPSGRTGPAFAAIGLGGMLNSGGAILSSEVVPRVHSGSGVSAAAPPAGSAAASGGAYWNSSARVVEWTARVTMRGGGDFVAFVNAPPRRVLMSVDGAPQAEVAVDWRRREGGVLHLAVPEDALLSLLEITLESDPAYAYV